MIFHLFRCLALAALALSLVACGVLPKLPAARPPAEELFLQAMNELFAAAPGPAFAALRRDYPDSPWTATARSIAELRQARDAQEVRNRTLQQESNHLLQENRKLKEDLDKLRKLVIETERRRR